MSIIKDALEYLVSLKTNTTYELNGSVYSDNQLHRIPPHIDRPDKLIVNGLDSIVKLIRCELGTNEADPLFVRVASPRTVEVFSSLDGTMTRNWLYEAKCDAPDFREGWMSQEEAVIKLRSTFIQNEGAEYLLGLISRLIMDDSVTSDDNGVTQTVTTRNGVSLKSFENTKSRITLCPYRTFTEVEQPESEFILRLDSELRIGLFEADGGAWKLQAKESIAQYFTTALAAEISDGSVVVMV